MKKLAVIYTLFAFVCVFYFNITIGLSFALSVGLIILSPLVCWFIPLWVLVGPFTFGELFIAELKDSTYYGWFLNAIMLALFVTGVLFLRDAQSGLERGSIIGAFILFYAFIIVKYYSRLYGITLIHSLAVCAVNLVLASVLGAVVYFLSIGAYNEFKQSDVSHSPFLSHIKSTYISIYEKDAFKQDGGVRERLKEAETEMNKRLPSSRRTP